MKLVLDTHVFLWWLADPQLLSAAVRSAIMDRQNKIQISAAVVWEIEIKRARGTLTAPDDLRGVIRMNRFRPLPITIAHAQVVRSLPDVHRDPFDRILIAQAISEKAHIVSRDAYFQAYNVPLIVA